MKSFHFNHPINDTIFGDYVFINSKADLNQSVSTLKSMLKSAGISLKTTTLKELFAQAAGYNSSNHLISKLPVAFAGARALVDLCLLIDERTQFCAYFEVLTFHQEWSALYAEQFAQLEALYEREEFCYVYVEALSDFERNGMGVEIERNFNHNVVLEHLAYIFPNRQGFDETDALRLDSAMMENFAILNFDLTQWQRVYEGHPEHAIDTVLRENTWAYLNQLAVEQKDTRIVKNNLSLLNEILEWHFGECQCEWLAPIKALFVEHTQQSMGALMSVPLYQKDIWLTIRNNSPYLLPMPSLMDIFTTIEDSTSEDTDHRLIESINLQGEEYEGEVATVRVFMGS